MYDQLQPRLPGFRTRLSETVAWCTGQVLETDPIESLEIRERRKMGEQAGKLYQRARLSHAPGLWKYYLRRRAVRLFAKAKLFEINPLAEQLRSTILHPDMARFRRSSEERIAIVEALAQKRAEALRQEQRYPISLVENLAEGRLLLYSPDDNLCDGAAQYSSKGFFNVDNVPPWDTWLCFFERHLVSWVPPKLLSLVNAGIDVNPEQCIFWAPESGLSNV